MKPNQIIEYIFFFGFLAFVSYLVWQIMAPFISALALSAIIVTICYPLYERMIKRMPYQSPTLAALATTLLVLVIIIFPFAFITSALVGEAVAVYRLADTGGQTAIENMLTQVETTVQDYMPGFELNATEYLQQGASWLSTHLGAIFAGTASTVLLFFMSLLGSFYFFRDGRDFIKWLITISPLPNMEDELIFSRLAQAIRSVATGTILVALIQGTLTAIGLGVLGFDRAILWGAIAAFGALIPSIGTSIVFIPAFAYSMLTGDVFTAVAVAAWGILAVGLIDNLLGPYLMSRGNKMHPFVTLLSVLGGVSLFGPIGFIVGPVVVSLFMVLFELYSVYLVVGINPKKK